MAEEVDEGKGVQKWSLEWKAESGDIREPLPKRRTSKGEAGGSEGSSARSASQSGSQSVSASVTSSAGARRAGPGALVPAGTASSSGLRESSSAVSASESSSSSSSSSGSAPSSSRRGLLEDRPLDAPVELAASEKSGSLRSFGEASSKDAGEAKESDPLLGGRSRGPDSMSSFTGSVQSSIGHTFVDDDKEEKAALQRQALRRQLLQALCCLCCTGGVGAAAAQSYQRRQQIRDVWRKYHPEPCVFTEWTDWGPCSKTCGIGLMSATRTFGPSMCKPEPWPGELRHERGCELQACGGRPCRVGPWGPWGQCSEPCGPGERTRLRPVLGRPDSTGGTCPALSQQTGCELHPCSPLCHLTPWSRWSPCSRTCGPGQMTRSRWSPCSRTCGPGQMTRSRTSRPLEPDAFCPRDRETIDCELRQCNTHCHFELPPEIPHAVQESLMMCDGTESGSTCTFACKDGLEPDGPLVCVGGIFLEGPRCFERPCKQAPVVQDSVGLEACRGLESGNRCRLTCRAGFWKTGDLVCRAGAWSDERCEELRCAEPSPIPHSLGYERNISHCLGRRSGEVCSRFGCEAGYVKKGELVCKGINFNHPRCEEAPCQGGPPAIWNSVLEDGDKCQDLAHRGKPISSRTVCPVTCDKGYAKTGDTVCVRGEWRPAQCLPEDQVAELRLNGQLPGWCGSKQAPTIIGADPVHCGGAQSGASCELRCGGGLRKSSDLLCAGGEWQEATCSGRPCARKPDRENTLDLSACAGANAGDACGLACGPGFDEVEEALRCDDGVWEGPRCLPLNCSFVPVPRYAVGTYESCDGMLPGQWCPLRCEAGHFPVPREGFECVPGGRFEMATCQPSKCNHAPLIPNSGDMEACVGAPSGSFCQLRCAAGYRADGDLYCDDGVWTNATCSPRTTCEAVPAIPHAALGLFDCIDVPSGQACKNFTCRTGYVPTGDLQCRNGHFSRPSCAEARCTKTPPIEHTKPGWSCEAKDGGGQCPVVCEEGYAKTNDVVCHKGVFCCAACLDLRDSVVRKTNEVLSVELRVQMAHGEWSGREQGTALPARLTHALAEAGGIAPSRLIQRLSRPQTIDTTAIDFDILPAVSIAEPSAQEAVDAASQVLRNAPRNATSRVASRPAPAFRRLQEPAAAPLPALLGAGAELHVARRGSGGLCRDVPVVANGGDLTACANTLSGGLCLLLCEEGYMRTADLYCMMGEWSVAACVGAPCSKAPEVDHAEDLSHCTGAASGSTCALVCQAGYEKTGDLECRGGAWQPGQACLPQACLHAPLVPLGWQRELRECRGMASGQECVLRCAPGHLPTGSGILRCELGNWRRLGECRPSACYYVPSVLHAATDLTDCVGTKSEEECRFECEPGFEKIGELLCLEGQFQEARCKPLECDAPPVVSGLGLEAADDCAPFVSGKACSPVCKKDDMVLSSPLVCRRGQWHKTACVSVEVPRGKCDEPPAIPYSADVLPCLGRSTNEPCNVRCDSGYRLDGLPYCDGGTWTPAACEPERCTDPPRVMHSEDLDACAGMDHGSLCPLRCLAGYAAAGLRALPPGPPLGVPELQRLEHLVAASSLTCRFGHWRGPRCEEAPCDSVPPGVVHARGLERCIGTPSRQVCGLECEPGYSPVSFPHCERGVWISMDLAQCEEAPCRDRPNVSHARDLSHCINRRSGQACQLECEDGYEPNGELRCYRGVWLPVECVAHCNALPLFIEHASDVSHCAGTRAGGFCQLACSPGFRPSGELRCLASGQWEVSVSCYDASELGSAAKRLFQLSGLKVPGDPELERTEGSIRKSFADMLHISLELVSVVLHWRAAANACDVELKIFCGGPSCTGLRRRLDDLGRSIIPPVQQTLCKDECGSAQDATCRSRCLERLHGLRAEALGKAEVVAAPVGSQT